MLSEEDEGGGVGWLEGSLDSKSDQKKKKKFLHSYKKVQEEKNPHRVQRDLSLIRQKQFL